MANEIIEPIYEAGNSGLITRKLNAIGNDYIGEPKKWFSDKAGDVLVAVEATFSYEPTNQASGNNPAHLTVYPEPTGTGTITIFGADDEEWAEISPVKIDNKWGVGFAPADIKNTQFGFAYDTNKSDGSKTKIFIPRCQMTGIPKISTTTNTETGKDIKKVEIPIKIFAVYKGNERLEIYYRINSVKYIEGYNALKETLVMPFKEPVGG